LLIPPVGASGTAKLTAKETNAEISKTIIDKLPVAPQRAKGDISTRYIGTTTVLTPPTNPETSLPIRIVGKVAITVNMRPMIPRISAYIIVDLRPYLATKGPANIAPKMAPKLRNEAIKDISVVVAEGKI